MTDERRSELQKAVHCLHITNCPTSGVDLIVGLVKESLADSEALEKVRRTVKLLDETDYDGCHSFAARAINEAMEPSQPTGGRDE